MQNFLWWLAVIGLGFATLARLYISSGGLEDIGKTTSTPLVRFGVSVVCAPFFVALWLIVLRAKP